MDVVKDPKAKEAAKGRAKEKEKERVQKEKAKARAAGSGEPLTTEGQCLDLGDQLHPVPAIAAQTPMT